MANAVKMECGDELEGRAEFEYNVNTVSASSSSSTLTEKFITDRNMSMFIKTEPEEEINDGSSFGHAKTHSTLDSKDDNTPVAVTANNEDNTPVAVTANNEGSAVAMQNVMQLLHQVRDEQMRQAAMQERQAHDIEHIIYKLEIQAEETSVLMERVSNTNSLVKGQIEQARGCHAEPQSLERKATNSLCEMQKPDIPLPMLSVLNGFVYIPIRHEDMSPGTVYNPVAMKVEDYAGLRNRCITASTFVRGLMGHFFEPAVLKKSNYEGTQVVTKNGLIQKDQLDRRLIMSLLDQAELEFPGQVLNKTSFSKIRSVINDKCRHS